MRPNSHVSDDRLVELCLEHTSSDHEALHLAGCERCRMRHARLESMLREMRSAADVETDAIFPPERLAAQHARILQRVEQDGRPARVIAFPAVPAVDTRPLRTRPAARWIAGAAAAGLAIGLLTGLLVQDLPFGRQGRPALVSSRGVESRNAQVVNASFNDEQFLVEVETALDGPHLAVLQPLNDLTPEY
jgi:anti-sigma factor RsiW